MYGICSGHSRVHVLRRQAAESENIWYRAEHCYLRSTLFATAAYSMLA